MSKERGNPGRGKRRLGSTDRDDDAYPGSSRTVRRYPAQGSRLMTTRNADKQFQTHARDPEDEMGNVDSSQRRVRSTMAVIGHAPSASARSPDPETRRVGKVRWQDFKSPLTEEDIDAIANWDENESSTDYDEWVDEELLADVDEMETQVKEKPTKRQNNQKKKSQTPQYTNAPVTSANIPDIPNVISIPFVCEINKVHTPIPIASDQSFFTMRAAIGQALRCEANGLNITYYAPWFTTKKMRMPLNLGADWDQLVKGAVAHEQVLVRRAKGGLIPQWYIQLYVGGNTADSPLGIGEGASTKAGVQVEEKDKDNEKFSSLLLIQERYKCKECNCECYKLEHDYFGSNFKKGTHYRIPLHIQNFWALDIDSGEAQVAPIPPKYLAEIVGLPASKSDEDDEPRAHVAKPRGRKKAKVEDSGANQPPFMPNPMAWNPYIHPMYFPSPSGIMPLPGFQLPNIYGGPAISGQPFPSIDGSPTRRIIESLDDDPSLTDWFKAIPEQKYPLPLDAILEKFHQNDIYTLGGMFELTEGQMVKEIGLTLGMAKRLRRLGREYAGKLARG
ncbi:hypothetical protein FRC17_004637 [Serendipita sp. 399]|nr:hypothetical protein FRC17_004637 [Serendipita sp. 399]